MKITHKNQQCKPIQTKSPSAPRIVRKVRESEPNLILEDTLFTSKAEKEEQPEKPKKTVRQPRHSEVLFSAVSSELFHSPQHQIATGVGRPGFHSPDAMKKPVRIKSSSSTYLEAQNQPASLVLKNNIGKPQTKNRKNPIQNHKQTLNKIEEMLLSHGVKLASPTVEKKNEQKNQIRNVKSPLTREKHENAVGNTKSRLLSKLNCPSIPQKDEESRQLKETVSTHSSYKSSRQLKVGDFEQGKELGKGKFGVVRMVRHRKTGLFFCLKIIKKAMIVKEELQEQLIKQTKIQMFLNEPNIAKLYAVFDDAENVYLLLQLCCEGNLYQLMKRSGKVPENETRNLIRSICEGVKVLHQQNIIHRDLKPENIVMCYGMAKICDFGWSTQYKDVMRETFCGTPLYVSPELLSGSCYDEKVDLWAIGILTYEMLTGRNPFEIKTEKDLSKIISAKITFPPGLSSEATSFMGDLLEKDPQKRKGIVEMLGHSFLQSRKPK